MPSLTTSRPLLLASFKTTAALVLLVMLSGWGVFHYRSAEARTRRYFGMGFFAPLNQATIEQAVQKALPLGTPEARVREYLVTAGIGADGMSGYRPPDAQHRAVVRIDFDPDSPALVKRHLAIVMFFDARSHLERVQAKDWLTGL